MRVLRRASLLLSLALIVAIAVGYFARRAEVAHERDLGLTTAAQIGASQMSAIVDSIEIAAAAGAEPQAVADAIVRNHPALGVCVIATGDEACAGAGPEPTPDVVTEHRVRRLAGAGLHERTTVAAYDTSITIDVDGPVVSVVAVMPFDSLSNRGAVSVWATTFLPKDPVLDTFRVENGIRQTATAVTVATNLYIVAATEDAIPLPDDERRFYLLIFGLAVVLLLLAGITLVIEHQSLVERASFDPLTKLPNRSEFERCAGEMITSVERQGTGLCVLLFDLDGFKQVNDTYGHAAGDEMLKVVGSRLRKAVRDDDLVARWGGDEFVVVMPGIVDDEMGVRRAQQLAEQVSGRTRLDGIADALRVKVSVGIALWPTHGAALEQLVESADQAMYQAKRDGDTYRLAEVAPAPVDAAGILA